MGSLIPAREYQVMFLTREIEQLTTQDLEENCSGMLSCSGLPIFLRDGG